MSNPQTIIIEKVIIVRSKDTDNNRRTNSNQGRNIFGRRRRERVTHVRRVIQRQRASAGRRSERQASQTEIRHGQLTHVERREVQAAVAHAHAEHSRRNNCYKRKRGRAFSPNSNTQEKNNKRPRKLCRCKTRSKNKSVSSIKEDDMKEMKEKLDRQIDNYMGRHKDSTTDDHNHDMNYDEDKEAKHHSSA